MCNIYRHVWLYTQFCLLPCEQILSMPQGFYIPNVRRLSNGVVAITVTKPFGYRNLHTPALFTQLDLQLHPHTSCAFKGTRSETFITTYINTPFTCGLNETPAGSHFLILFLFTASARNLPSWQLQSRNTSEMYSTLSPRLENHHQFFLKIITQTTMKFRSFIRKQKKSHNRTLHHKLTPYTRDLNKAEECGWSYVHATRAIFSVTKISTAWD